MKEYCVTYSTIYGGIKTAIVSAPSKASIDIIMMDYDWDFLKILNIELI